MQTVLLWLTHYGYPALFSLLMFGIVGLPVPDETLLTFCGFLIYSGRLHFGWTFVSGFLGSVSGISISYFIGSRFGHPFLTRFGKFIRLTPERFLHVERMFDRFGPILLTIGYFIPGVRHFTAVVAGMSGLRWPKFALFAYTGAALWVGTFLSLGYIFGERWEHTSEVVHRYTLIATAVLAAILALVWLIRRLRIDHRNRHRLQ
jgi:membrane protein DedA with SNARE-associated domain